MAPVYVSASQVIIEERETPEETPDIPTVPLDPYANVVDALAEPDSESRYISPDVECEHTDDETYEEENGVPFTGEPDVELGYEVVPSPAPSAQPVERPNKALNVPAPTSEAKPFAPATPADAKPFAGVMGSSEGAGQRGRPAGHSNVWVFYNLLYLARHGRVVAGTPPRMVDYYKNHPKLGMAKGVVKKEREGKHVDYTPYFKNLAGVASAARVRGKS